jgi:hypothetical protein
MDGQQEAHAYAHAYEPSNTLSLGNEKSFLN